MSRSLPLLLLALPLLLAGCGDHVDADGSKSELQGAVRQREATRVRVAQVERREMVATIETTTNLESDRRVSITPRISGEVVEIVAEEGDAVQAGEVLARLDPRDAQVALDEARIALAEAEHAVARAKVSVREAEARIDSSRLAFENAQAVCQRNEGERLISAQEFEKLELDRDTFRSQWDQSKLALEIAKIDEQTRETNRQKAEFEVQRAELALSYTALRAPFAGTVTQRSVRRGDHLTMGTEAFVLIDLDDLRAEFYRPQRELAIFASARVEDGGLGAAKLSVTVRAEALPNLEFAGEILRVSPDIDPASGSFRITVDIEPLQHDVRLLPGMLVRLNVVTERHPDALVVSKRALRREGETSVIFAVRDGKAVRIVVDELFSGDSHVEVRPRELYSLEAGESVVIVGNRDLEDGDEVNVTKPADADPVNTTPAVDAASREPADKDVVNDGPADTENGSMEAQATESADGDDA